MDAFEPVVRVGELATITFHCGHADVALCAPAYRVFLSGPTLASPLYSRSSERMDERHVRVSFELKDPGQYEVFAFAEHETCEEWKEGEAVPCESSCERLAMHLRRGANSPLSQSTGLRWQTPR